MATVTDSAYDMDEKARMSPAYKSETVKPRAGTAAVAGGYLWSYVETVRIPLRQFVLPVSVAQLWRRLERDCHSRRNNVEPNASAIKAFATAKARIETGREKPTAKE